MTESMARTNSSNVKSKVRDGLCSLEPVSDLRWPLCPPPDCNKRIASKAEMVFAMNVLWASDSEEQICANLYIRDLRDPSISFCDWKDLRCCNASQVNLRAAPPPTPTVIANANPDAPSSRLSRCRRLPYPLLIFPDANRENSAGPKENESASAYVRSAIFRGWSFGKASSLSRINFAHRTQLSLCWALCVVGVQSSAMDGGFGS